MTTEHHSSSYCASQYFDCLVLPQHSLKTSLYLVSYMILPYVLMAICCYMLISVHFIPYFIVKNLYDFLQTDQRPYPLQCTYWLSLLYSQNRVITRHNILWPLLSYFGSYLLISAFICNGSYLFIQAIVVPFWLIITLPPLLLLCY